MMEKLKKVHKEEYPHEEFGEIELKDIPRVKKLSGPQLVQDLGRKYLMLRNMMK